MNVVTSAIYETIILEVKTQTDQQPESRAVWGS